MEFHEVWQGDCRYDDFFRRHLALVQSDKKKCEKNLRLYNVHTLEIFGEINITSLRKKFMQTLKYFFILKLT